MDSLQILLCMVGVTERPSVLFTLSILNRRVSRDLCEVHKVYVCGVVDTSNEAKHDPRTSKGIYNNL